MVDLAASLALPLRSRLLALGAGTPVNDLGFVNYEPVVVGGLQARPVPYRALDVFRAAASATDEVVVVVIDSVLIAGGRARRLDAPNEAIIGQYAEGVVYRLAGDGTDLRSYELSDLVCRAVRPTAHCPENSQTLSGNLDTAPAQRVGCARACFPEHELDYYSDSGLCQVQGTGSTAPGALPNFSCSHAPERPARQVGGSAARRLGNWCPDASY